jgi:hypothetical protein
MAVSRHAPIHAARREPSNEELDLQAGDEGSSGILLGDATYQRVVLVRRIGI